MRAWSVVAGLNGAMAVAMGAYAAHGLAADAYLRDLGEQAAHFQLVHALALLAADRLAENGPRLAHGAAALFVVGIALFCGSLYVKALTGAPLGVPMITPAGGVTLIAAWLALAAAAAGRRAV